MCSPATSPSLMSRMRAPASRHSLIRSACLGRSKMHTVTSLQIHRAVEHLCFMIFRHVVFVSHSEVMVPSHHNLASCRSPLDKTLACRVLAPSLLVLIFWESRSAYKRGIAGPLHTEGRITVTVGLKLFSGGETVQWGPHWRGLLRAVATAFRLRWTGYSRDTM